MADRFPQNEATAKVREIVKSSLEEMHKGPPPFDYEDGDGRLIGCYAPMPYAPHIAPAAFSFMKAIYSNDTLPARTRQMGILAVASVYQSPYVEYCHREVSRHLGFTETQFESAIAGTTPESVSAEEAMAYDTAQKLLEPRGPLDDESFLKASAVLGESGVAGLMYVVAGYHFVCIMLKTAGPRPGGWSPTDS